MSVAGPRGVGRGISQWADRISPTSQVSSRDPEWISISHNVTAHAMQILPAVRSQLAQARGNPEIEISRSRISRRISRARWMPPDFPSPSAYIVNLGVQREIVRDLYQR